MGHSHASKPLATTTAVPRLAATHIQFCHPSHSPHGTAARTHTNRNTPNGLPPSNRRGNLWLCSATAASRTALDPSRRLTGARADAERGMRTLAAAAGDPQPRAARELLARVLGLVAQAPLRESANMLSQLSEAGEAALAVDPDDRTWQETSAAVLRLRGRIASGAHAAEIDAAVRDVVSRLTTQALRGVPTITKTDADLLRLEGALLTGGRGR